jgi:hypothetical protein
MPCLRSSRLTSATVGSIHPASLPLSVIGRTSQSSDWANALEIPSSQIPKMARESRIRRYYLWFVRTVQQEHVAMRDADFRNDRYRAKCCRACARGCILRSGWARRP